MFFELSSKNPSIVFIVQTQIVNSLINDFYLKDNMSFSFIFKSKISNYTEEFRQKLDPEYNFYYRLVVGKMNHTKTTCLDGASLYNILFRPNKSMHRHSNLFSPTSVRHCHPRAIFNS